MTLTEILKIGDRVVFTVSAERRAHTDTYNNIPDGTIGVVCGFYDAVVYESRIPVYMLVPGVYHSKGAPSVLLSDGRIVPGSWVITMVDKEEEKRRSAMMRDINGILQTKYTRLGDLPETKFWEDDKVLVNFPSGHELPVPMTISLIDYNKWPFYDVLYPERQGMTAAEESWITLVERGNVWKYYHNEPIVFADLQEEATFATRIGQTTEVRNPVSGRFDWTKEEVLAAIQAGTVHGFSISNLFRTSHIVAKLFKDENLGKRVAEETLKGLILT